MKNLAKPAFLAYIIEYGLVGSVFIISVLVSYNPMR